MKSIILFFAIMAVVIFIGVVAGRNAPPRRDGLQWSPVPGGCVYHRSDQWGGVTFSPNPCPAN